MGSAAVITPIPLVSILRELLFIRFNRIESHQTPKRGKGRAREGRGAAALHTAPTVLAFKWATPGQVHIYEFLQHAHPPLPPPLFQLKIKL